MTRMLLTIFWTLFLTSLRRKKSNKIKNKAHEGFEPPTSESKSDVMTTTLMGHIGSYKLEH